MRNERGTVTLWVLGLCVALMFLGGLAVDLWRGIAVRRELSAVADAAATAGTNGLEQSALRRGEAGIDPGAAEALALEIIEQSDRSYEAVEVDVGPDFVTVTLEDEVPLSLLGIFVRGEPLTVRASADARPVVRP